MNERVKKVTTFVKDKWSGFSNAIRIMVIAIPVAIIAIIIILAILLNNKDRVVLFTELEPKEAGQLVTAIKELGVSDVVLTDNGNIEVPIDQADMLRMQLSVQGYPTDSLNYDIWDTGINLWSTDKDKREKARQQREERIAATLKQLNSVASATAILTMPDTPDYVITPTSEQPRCAVTLKLRDENGLTNAEVRAIFRLIETSVDGMTIDNISVTDTLGRSYLWVSEEEEKSGQRDESGVLVARRRQLFRLEMEQAIKSALNDTLAKVYGENGYALNVAANLNYDKKKVEVTEYQPVEGTNAGVLNHETHTETYTDLENANGVVGVTPNGDISPDYPTISGLEDGESYYYKNDEMQYDVTNIKTTIEGDGYSIDSLSVGVFINSTNMTETEREGIEETVARAAGTTVDMVSVTVTPFALSPTGGTTIGDGSGFGIITRPVDSFRNTLLIVVIALGVILILLLIASLFVSRSRKKKIRRRQELAIAAAQAAAAQDGFVGNGEQDTPREVDFNIASLTEEAGKDSRETILKREIAEFAKTNPDIVASIIKSMLRDDAAAGSK